MNTPTKTAMMELIEWMKTEQFKDALSGIEKATELLVVST